MPIVVQDITHLKQQFERQTAMMEEMLKAMKATTDAGVDLLPEFPLATRSEFDDLECRLLDTAVRRQMVSNIFVYVLIELYLIELFIFRCQN